MLRSFYTLFFILAIVNTCLSQFKEVSTQIGVENLHTSPLLMGGGAVFFDFNNDGFLDIYATGGEGQDQLFQNLGNGEFTDVSPGSGIAEITAASYTAGVIAGDINNDGWKDLFVVTYDNSPNILLLNQGKGIFKNITNQSGIADNKPSIGATFLDFDLDGWLDIYVIKHLKEFNFVRDQNNEIVGLDNTCYANTFFINQGDNTFVEAAKELGIDNTGCGLAVLATDYDQDGDQDIMVANDYGAWVSPNVIYQNNYPKPTFVDKSKVTNLNPAIYAMGIARGDYDEDGDFDYYITNLGRNVLLQNNGNNIFIDVTIEAKVEDETKPDGASLVGWGTFFFDYDNDTYLDLFVSNGFISGGFFEVTSPGDNNSIYSNTGNGYFNNVTKGYAMGDTLINRGAVYGDYDNDGDLDIFISSVYPEKYNKSIHSLLYKNQHSGNNWLEVRLEGTTSNRDGFGSLVTVYAGGREFIRELSSGGSHASQNSDILHFGLGQLKAVQNLEVKWPGGMIQTYQNLPVNQKIFLKQGEPNYEVLGCMDPGSTTYNPLATLNTGCYVEAVMGCTNTKSSNYDPNATVNDGSCILPIVTGIENKELNFHFQVYPIPFRNRIFIHWEGQPSNSWDVKLIDMMGREYYYLSDWLGDKLSIDTQNYGPGVYLVFLNDRTSSRQILRKIFKF